MKIFLLIVLIAGLSLVLWRFAARRKAPALPRPAAPRTQYHSVSVSTGLSACRAAEQIRGQRFLPGEAPVLPLPGCGEPRCECRYEHHADRRAEERRDPFSHFDGFKPTPVHDDQRRGWDRRRRRQ